MKQEKSVLTGAVKTLLEEELPPAHWPAYTAVELDVFPLKDV